MPTQQTGSANTADHARAQVATLLDAAADAALDIDAAAARR